MNSSSSLLVPEFLQMTVLNLVLGGTIFTEGGHYSPVNNVLGGQYSLVNNVRGDIFGGDTIHYDTGLLESLPLGCLSRPVLVGEVVLCKHSASTHRAFFERYWKLRSVVPNRR